MIRITLDIATLLGGIAALWFFWDKFTAYRTRLRKQESLREELRSQFVLLLFLLATFCATGGIFASLAILRLGLWGAIGTIIIAIVIVVIGSFIDQAAYETIIFPVLIGSGYMLWWAIIVMVVSIIAMLYAGVSLNSYVSDRSLIIVGIVVGAIYGSGVLIAVFSESRQRA
ncbi:MAG TPA: hypothetical protein VF528_17985 [Pyrinomonadaceae bacterium]|jgi:hypothetical protein